MILIVYVNIVISALIKDGISRELLFYSPFTLYSSDTLIESTTKYENLILEKSELSKEDFEKLLSSILQNIKIVERSEYEKYMEEANKLMGQIDIEDVPFIALALSINNDGIWSDDAHFKQQDKVKVYTTEELFRLLEE